MQTFRRILFWLHLICGVGVGLVVFTMSATGVALMYEKQLAHWADGYRSEPEQGAQSLRPEELLARAQAEDGREPTGIALRSDPAEHATVYFGRQAAAVNPYTGKLLGEGATGWRKFFRQMIVWHRWLGQEGDGRAVGKAITGVSNLAFVFIIVSGVYLWWPKQWSWQYLRPIMWFRGGLGGKARDFNWHNVIGFWGLLPLFLMAGTGTFFSYSWPGQMLYAITGEVPASRGGGSSREKAKEQLPGPPWVGLDAMWATVAGVEPDWRTITVRFAETPGQTASFTVDRGNFGTQPHLRSTVVVDRATGNLVRQETLADMKKARQARSWIRFIHTGEAGGWIGQTIAGVGSLGACFLVYTGWALSWRRFFAWRRRRASSGSP